MSAQNTDIHRRDEPGNVIAMPGEDKFVPDAKFVKPLDDFLIVSSIIDQGVVPYHQKTRFGILAEDARGCGGQGVVVLLWRNSCYHSDQRAAGRDSQFPFDGCVTL